MESFLMYPFILTGTVIGLLNPFKKKYSRIFFFPFYHTGGAEKIHCQVLEAAGNEDCLVFFTRKSQDTRFLDSFKKTNAVIKDISSFTDNKALYFLNIIFRGIISAQINAQKTKTVVFNGQCNFGYKISPWIKTTVPQYELIHSFNTFSFIRIPFLPFITKTVMISRLRIEEHIAFYKKAGIPAAYAEKIIYTGNAVKFTGTAAVKSTADFTVLYVGRNSPEKRLHLFLQTAAKVQQADKNIRFEILGDVAASIPAAQYPFITFHGNQDDTAVINRIYANAHALLLPSSTEGFPLVIIEAMFNGCAVLATPVGDIPFHIKSREHGLVFSTVTGEAAIVTEAADFIIELKNNRLLFETISKNNSNYAAVNFNIEKFNTAYNQLLES